MALSNVSALYVAAFCAYQLPTVGGISTSVSRENSVKRKSASQTSLSKKDSENQSEAKRLVQEESVEEGSVSGLFFTTICFFFNDIFDSVFVNLLQKRVLSLFDLVIIVYCSNNSISRKTPVNY